MKKLILFFILGMVVFNMSAQHYPVLQEDTLALSFAQLENNYRESDFEKAGCMAHMLKTKDLCVVSIYGAYASRIDVNFLLADDTILHLEISPAGEYVRKIKTKNGEYELKVFGQDVFIEALDRDFSLSLMDRGASSSVMGKASRVQL